MDKCGHCEYNHSRRLIERYKETFKYNLYNLQRLRYSSLQSVASSRSNSQVPFFGTERIIVTFLTRRKSYVARGQRRRRDRNIIPTSLPAYKRGRRRRNGTTPTPNFVAEFSKRKKKRKERKCCRAVFRRIEISYFVPDYETLKKKKKKDDSFLFIDNLMNPQVTEIRNKVLKGRELLFHLLSIILTRKTSSINWWKDKIKFWKFLRPWFDILDRRNKFSRINIIRWRIRFSILLNRASRWCIID